MPLTAKCRFYPGGRTISGAVMRAIPELKEMPFARDMVKNTARDFEEVFSEIARQHSWFMDDLRPKYKELLK